MTSREIPARKTVEQIEAATFASMAELASANDIKVILCSILPAYDYPWKPGLEPAPKIIAINAWLRDYARRSTTTCISTTTPP